MSTRYRHICAPFFVLLGLAVTITSPSLAAQDRVKVAVAEAEHRELIEEVPLSGTVTSPKRAMLSTEVAGLIRELSVDAGDKITAGQLLVKLDPVLSETDRDSAEANAAAARAALEDAKRRLDEAQTLAGQNNIAASEVRTRQAQVDIEAANMQAAEAEARRQQAELTRHSITAPFAGTVTRKLAEVGEWLSPGAAVVELVATEDLRIDFEVPQRFYSRISDSSQISIRFDAYPEVDFSARVHRMVPLSRADTRTFLLRTRLDQQSAEVIIPGMSANAVLKLRADGGGITVPRDAVQRYPDGRISVWVIEDVDNEQGTARVREQQIDTGISFADQTHVREGLSAGQQVVTRGNEALNDDQQVEIVPAN